MRDDLFFVGGVDRQAKPARVYETEVVSSKCNVDGHLTCVRMDTAGCNIGGMYVVTKDGFENLSRHTPLETHRVAAEA